MARVTQTSAQVAHCREIRQQLMDALCDGTLRIAFILHSGEVILGGLQGNHFDGLGQQVSGDLTMRATDDETLTIDFLDVKFVDRR